MYGKKHCIYYTKDFFIYKHNKLSCLYMNYMRLINSRLITTLFPKNNKSMIKFKYLVINIYS